MAGQQLAIVPIRYDGLDAEHHQIELHLLGESLQGIARILAVTGHFATTGRYAKQLQALDVKVFVEEPKANCYSLQAVVDFAKDYQLFSGAGGVALGTLVSWVFARSGNNRAEMKALKDSLDKSIALLAGQNAELVPKLLSTLEKMADSLRPSVRAAVAPVGKTCTHMRIGSEAVIDEAAAEAIRSEEVDDVTEERTWLVLITELDRENLSAKVRFVDDGDHEDRRFKAVITDPAFNVQGNPYLSAFVNQEEIAVRAKATMRGDDIQTLYINNTEELLG